MSSGTQVDLDWAGTDSGQGGSGSPAASTSNADARGASYLTDEEILGIDSSLPDGGFSGGGNDHAARAAVRQDAAPDPGGPAEAGAAKSKQAEASSTGTMPEWMATLAADPAHGGEAQLLWREHQEFRAAFSSPEGARAIKELLPGGVRDVLSLRDVTQSVDRIDAAIFSGDARAQSEEVAELARANPAAFRSMFAEATKVLAGVGSRDNEAGSGRQASHQSRVTRHQSRITSHQSRITNHKSRITSHRTSIPLLMPRLSDRRTTR